MSMSSSKTRLAAITKQLSVNWEQTKESWKDLKSQEFERAYMTELLAGVDQAVTVIDQLDKLIAKVKDDCQ